MLKDSDLAPPLPLEECDESIVRSALARPETGWGALPKYPDIPAKAAALTYGLAKSQACVDGNKRVALILLKAFLQLNNQDIEASDEDISDQILNAAASDAVEVDAATATLREWLDAVMVRPSEGA